MAAVEQEGGVSGSDMRLYDLRVVVERIEGRGVCGMEIGDEITLTRSSQLRIPAGRHFCLYALSAVLPLLAAKQRVLAAGDWLERDAHVACPDPDERLVMRIERTGMTTLDSPRPDVSGRVSGGDGTAVGGAMRTRRREVGLGIQGDKTPGSYAAIGRTAEGHGFDVLSVFGDLMFAPPVVPLLEMAAATSRVRLGAACYNPYTLHPYEIAGQVAALDAASGGRAYWGLARGTWLGAIGVPQPRPVAHLRAAAALVTALLSGDDAGIESQLFPLAPGTRLRHPRPASPPPLLIGTWGPATAALAGEIADEVKIGGTANPAMVEVLRRRIDVGCARVGRDPAEVGIVVGAVTVVDSDGRAARARARREVAMYLGVVAGLDPTADVEQGLIDAVADHVRRADDEGAGRLINDDVLDLFAFAGTPDHVAAQAQALLDAGASRVEFGTPHGLTDLGGVTALGRDVLPLLHDLDVGHG